MLITRDKGVHGTGEEHRELPSVVMSGEEEYTDEAGRLGRLVFVSIVRGGVAAAAEGEVTPTSSMSLRSGVFGGVCRTPGG